MTGVQTCALPIYRNATGSTPTSPLATVSPTPPPLSSVVQPGEVETELGSGLLFILFLSLPGLGWRLPRRIHSWASEEAGGVGGGDRVLFVFVRNVNQTSEVEIGAVRIGGSHRGLPEGPPPPQLNKKMGKGPE